MSRYCRSVTANRLGGAHHGLGTERINAAIQTGTTTSEASSALLLLSSVSTSCLGRQQNEVADGAKFSRILGAKSRDFEGKCHHNQRGEKSPKRRRMSNAEVGEALGDSNSTGTASTSTTLSAKNETRNGKNSRFATKTATPVPRVVGSAQSVSGRYDGNYTLDQPRSRDITSLHSSATCASNDSIASGFVDPYRDPGGYQYEQQLLLRREFEQQRHRQQGNNRETVPSSSMSLHLPHLDVFVFPTGRNVHPLEQNVDITTRYGRCHPNIHHPQSSLAFTAPRLPHDQHRPPVSRKKHAGDTANGKDVDAGNGEEMFTTKESNAVSAQVCCSNDGYQGLRRTRTRAHLQPSGGAVAPSQLDTRPSSSTSANASSPQLLGRSIPEAPKSSPTGTMFNKDIANRLSLVSTDTTKTATDSTARSTNDKMKVPEAPNLKQRGVGTSSLGCNPSNSMREVPEVPSLWHARPSSHSQSSLTHRDETLTDSKFGAMTRPDSGEDTDENEHVVPERSSMLSDATSVVYELNRNDYLLGHGGYARCYPGNKRARHLMQLLLPSFVSGNKVKRRILAERVVRNVYAHGGRFLTELNGTSSSGASGITSHSKNTRSGGWVVLSHKEAVRRIGQRFREDLNGPRDKRAIETLHQKD